MFESEELFDFLGGPAINRRHRGALKTQEIMFTELKNRR